MDIDSKERLYEGLLIELQSDKFRRQYQLLIDENPQLNSYPTVEVMLGMLRAKTDVRHSSKDAALRSLLKVVQRSDRDSDSALKILLVAMWPALDHAFYRLKPFSSGVPDLFAEIYWAFLAEIEHFPLTKRKKIAVNLHMNIEKRVRRAADLEGRYQRLMRAHWLLDPGLEEAAVESDQDPESFLLDQLKDAPQKEVNALLMQANRIRPYGSPCKDGERQGVRGVLDGLREGCLLTRGEHVLLGEHGVDGRNFDQIAERHGLTVGTARVRYFRAKQKLRAVLCRR